jgi:hypothetical protein
MTDFESAIYSVALLLVDLDHQLRSPRFRQNPESVGIIKIVVEEMEQIDDDIFYHRGFFDGAASNDERVELRMEIARRLSRCWMFLKSKEPAPAPAPEPEPYRGPICCGRGPRVKFQ